MKHVKGVLFLDFVRMLHAHKEVPLDRHLRPEDLRYLAERIDPAAWYPMEVYERMGLAILAEIARGDLQAVREWGRRTIDELLLRQPELFENADALELFMRFHVLRQSLFDFPAAQVTAIHDGQARLEIGYGMSATAEEAAVHQSLGFLERLIEVAGGVSPEVCLRSRSWAGDPATVIQVRWKRR